MPDYSISTTKTTGAAAAWQLQFRTGSARDARIWEVGLFTTTAVAGTYTLERSNSVGSTFTSTPVGAAVDPNSSAGVAVVDTAATGAPTRLGTPAPFRQIVFPATVGSGVIWTFPRGLVVPTSGGILLWQTTTAAVGLSFYIDYNE